MAPSQRAPRRKREHVGQDVEKCLSLVLAALVLKSPQKLPSDLEVWTRRLPSFGGHLSREQIWHG